MNFDLKLGKAASVLFLALAMAGCGGGGTTETTPETPVPDPAIKQRADIATAIGTAQTAVAAVNNDSTDTEVKTADDAITIARGAITAATNVPAEERAANTGTVNALASRLTAAKTARTMAMNDADKATEMAMMATAMKLHAGIGAPGGTGAETRTAAYGTGDNANDIAVTIGSADPVNLSEDKMAMVAAHNGWTGMKYMAEPDGAAGMYEAIVYSNVEAPTQGKKFGSAATVPNDNYEYQLTNGAVAVDTSVTGVPARVDLTDVTRTSGTETFKLPDPNPKGETIIDEPGSYHGVSGTYNCTPSTPADGCSASVAASGFTLGGGTWTFTPSDANARVMSAPDTMYASYGWWIHKSEDGMEFTASAFAANKGEPAATTVTALNGTATYMGGAAGKYALHSTTGGTNDAGHFTADATLEANFTDNMVSGRIDNFMGADGMARNWSVELMKSGVSAGGAIIGTDGTGTDMMMTKWTIDGTAAAAAGGWSGTLYNNGDDAVPKVATGTFYSMYGRDGKMVGAFGANKQ